MKGKDILIGAGIILSSGILALGINGDDSNSSLNIEKPVTNQVVNAVTEKKNETPPAINNALKEKPKVKVKEKKVSEPVNNNCHPSYSGCLRADASDYDCAGGSGNGPYYTGTVRVIGPDVFRLDRDGDGLGCE